MSSSEEHVREADDALVTFQSDQSPVPTEGGGGGAWECEVLSIHVLAGQPSARAAPAVSCGHATLHLPAFISLVGKRGSLFATSDYAL